MMKKIQLLLVGSVMFLSGLGLTASVRAEQILGKDGEVGINGKDGGKGQNRDSLTIFLDGTPLTLDLTGQKGFKGEDGISGQPATCPPQDQIKENVQGANGGSGGNGGTGGDGGNGGSVNLYATNLSYLKQVVVNASGGSGGTGGTGGTGGIGCSCLEPYVSIRSCKGSPGDSDYSCTTEEFRCLAGRNGANGSNGRSGKDGRTGSLTVLNLNRPLLEDQVSASISLKQLKENGYTLSKNIWETKGGAKALLGTGSVVQDQYRFLVNRSEYSLLVVWNTARPFEPFANQIVTLKLKDEPKGGIDYVLPKDIWWQTREQKQNNRTDLIVYNALLESEATQLEVVQLLGKEAGLTLNLVDKANVSDLVNTEWYLTLKLARSDRGFRFTEEYVTKYEGIIPTELITRSRDRFTIKLGNLPINAQELKTGLGISLELKIKRSLDNYSTEQRLRYENLIDIK